MINANDVTISKSQVDSELASLIAWNNDWSTRKSDAQKGKTFDERTSIYNSYQVEFDNYQWNEKYNSIIAVLQNPTNIERWRIESPLFSKSGAEAEKAFLISVDERFPQHRNKSANTPLPDGTPFEGLWGVRYNTVNKILADPINIERWRIEALTGVTASRPDSVFSSFEPTTSLGQVITNISDSIFPSIPEVQATSNGTILPPYAGTIDFVVSKDSPNKPNISTSNISQNSVSISWSSTGTGGSPITSYHYVLINKDNNQTITEQNFGGQQQGVYESGLTSGTNYKIYLMAVNAFGNSDENSLSFKTLGATQVVTTPVVTTPIVTTPVITPITYPVSDMGVVIPAVTPTPIIISAEVQAILTKFDNNHYEYPTWFNNNITWVKDGTITNEAFLNAFNNLLQAGTIIDKTIVIPPIEVTPVIDKSINENMVSQSIGAFKLEGNRVQGDILYIAESSFNPYYYNKTITSVIQIKDQEGFTVKTKTNNLNFTATERDERISIDENVGDLNAVKIDFFVWESIQSPIAFSMKKTDEIVAIEVGLSPCPIGQHRDFNNKCVPNDPIIGSSLLDKVMGITALIGTLALLGSKRR